MTQDSTGKNQGNWLAHRHRRPSDNELSREQLLEDWVGMERAASIKADLRPQTPTIGELVSEIMRKFKLDEVDVFDRLRTDWAGIVGPSIARECAPVNLANGTLTIAVRDTTWRFVLETQQKKAMLAKIQATLGKDTPLKTIRFISK